MNQKTKSFIIIPGLLILLAVIWGIIGKLAIKEKKDLVNYRNAIVFNKVTANLIVGDVNKTVEFYESIFKFKKVVSVPDSGKMDFALMSIGNVELMFQSKESINKGLPNLFNENGGGNTVLYFDINGIDELYKSVAEHCTVVKDMHETFYGTREFYIKDINGYILGFAERVEK